MPATRSTWPSTRPAISAITSANAVGVRQQRHDVAEQDPRLRVVRHQPDQLVDAPQQVRTRRGGARGHPRRAVRNRHRLRFGCAASPWWAPGLSAPTGTRSVAGRDRSSSPRGRTSGTGVQDLLGVLTDRGLTLAQRHLERRRQEDRREGADQHADEQGERDVPQRARTEEERADEQDRAHRAAARRPRC